MFTFLLKIFCLLFEFLIFVRFFFLRLVGILYKKSQEIRYFRRDWNVTKKITKKTVINHFFLLYLFKRLHKIIWLIFYKLSAETNYKIIFFGFIYNLRFFLNSQIPQQNIVYLWNYFRKVCISFVEYPQDLFDKLQHCFILANYFTSFNFFWKPNKIKKMANRELED